MEKIEEQFDNVILSREGNVATVTLNQPKVLNAMSPELMHDLRKALKIVAEDENVRAVIINGAGASFCAGGDVEKDVAPISKMKPFEYKGYIQGFFAVMREITWMEKPVIAAIKGYAVGGGFDLAMACDIRIAAQGVKMGNAYIRMGILSELGGIYFLPRLIGVGNAKFLLFTGDLITADEAYRMGLVGKVVPEEELAKVAKDLAEELARGPTKAIAMTKLAVNRSLSLDLEASTEYCQNLSLGLFHTEDHREAVAAFFEKRKPQFKGK